MRLPGTEAKNQRGCILVFLMGFVKEICDTFLFLIDKALLYIYAGDNGRTNPSGEKMNLDFSTITWTKARTWLLWLCLPLAVGLLVSLAIPQPSIGIIRLYDSIYSQSAEEMNNQIEYARQEPGIRAVVLVLDSPGGTVADTEAVYLGLSDLRREKPVVASVGSMAASGAYYLSAACDYIVVKPSSQVGNIGVIGYLPSSPMLIEDIASTGPYKMWGAPRDTYLREMEVSKQGFYQAVALGRGERLQVEKETLLRGQVWSGSEALRLGLVDQLGTESDAIKKAARLAGAWHYKVIELDEASGLSDTQAFPFYLQTDEGPVTSLPDKPGLYMLYIPPFPGQEGDPDVLQ